MTSANAQIAMSVGTYSQDFDSLANSGTANSWTDNSTLPGWYASKQIAPNVITTYRADNGGNNAGPLYSYGASASANRALGVGEVAFERCRLAFRWQEIIVVRRVKVHGLAPFFEIVPAGDRLRR